MQINMDSIMNKVRAYNRSAEGKERVAAYIDQCIRDRRGKTKGGSHVITLNEMKRLAAVFANMLYDEAAKAGLPESVMAHFRSLASSQPYSFDEGKSYAVDIFFTDNLHRDSLYDEEYRGINNIVALFNNGYSARDYVYGHWDGHKQISNSSFHLYSTETDAFIRSRLSRPALHFMQNAAQRFNEEYGDKYGVRVWLAIEYTAETGEMHLSMWQDPNDDHDRSER